jgi:hypothetical protein
MSKIKDTSPHKSTTQLFIEVEQVVDDIVVMRNRSASTIIEVGAVNFWLLSDEDQMSMIYTYGSLLNSLSFPVQIVIISKMMNISSYIDYLQGKINAQKNEVMRTRIEDYREFIKNIVKKNVVIEKRFFFVVPFNPLEMGVAGVKANKLSTEYIVNRAKTSLYPKRDHLLRLLAKVGLRPTIMGQQELVELFYNLYNPSSTGKQLAPIDSYTDIVLTNG